MAAPSARTPVAGRVFSQLVEDVLSGRYEPGEKLPTQRALAAELDVNMAPVREAVKRLEQLGLVEVRHGDAMRVTDWRASGSLDVIAHVLFAAGGLDRGTLAHLMEARRLMLAESARLAAERRDDAQARRLEALAARIAEAPDAATAQALDFAFFAELVDAARNVVLVLVMNSIRQIYFERAELFAAVVGGGHRAPLYARAARAVARGQVSGRGKRGSGTGGRAGAAAHGVAPVKALTPREASIFACFTDAVVAPEPALPPVRETDAVEFFDDWMARSPRLNRTGMRALLYVLELSPLATGSRKRLRRLDRAGRAAGSTAVEHAPRVELRLIFKLMKGAAQLSYWGDDALMLHVGYDADANVRRGRELRLREGRP